MQRPAFSLLRRSGLAALLAATLVMLALASRPAQSAPTALSMDDVYAYAGECLRLRDGSSGSYVTRDFFGYVLTPTVLAATPFRMQATDLGSYLLYGPDANMPSALSFLVLPTLEPGPAADWWLAPEGSRLRLTNIATGTGLTVAAFDRLTLDAQAGARWTFEPATGCAVFPEASVNIDSAPPLGSSPTAEVRGFLDAHVHVTGFDFLGGRLHCGRPWSRYGVADALKDCPDHAFNGAFAFVENLLSHETPFATHSTLGWPAFDGWPRYDSLTHEGTYWKGIERAWRAGLRLMVADLVENRALCEIYWLKQNPCGDMDSIRLQARDLYELQDYIDAQFKGPGKGFFRIVKSPDEARAVINQGKLAVVIGVETSQPFDCLYRLGQELCSREQIDRGLQELWDLGVRSMFPVHKFDNAFGGTAMDDGVQGILVNLGNKWMTGRWWEVEPCSGPDHDRTPFGILPASTDAIAPLAATPAPGGQLYSDLWEALFDGPLPSYPAGNICNVRGLTELGAYLVGRMADLGMIVEVDHFSVKARAQALDILEARGYSGVISSHSWSDPTSTRRLQELGGVVAPHVGTGPQLFIESWQQAKVNQPASFFFGLGFGTDTNGLSRQAPPRPPEVVAPPLTYPFLSFDGRSIEQNVWGERVWDFNLDGAAHYGLYADWVEEMRLVGGEDLLDDLARGAEAYLQMWSRAWASRQQR